AHKPSPRSASVRGAQGRQGAASREARSLKSGVNMNPERDLTKRKIFHVITKLELGGAQKVTLMTLERLPRDRYELGLIAGPEGLLVEWANRIPGLKRVWISSIVRQVRPIQDALAFVRLWRLFRR